MLCQFCQNLVFVPIEEVSVQNADWLTDPGVIFNPDKRLVSVHQPSRKALELSAGQGCRVGALIWFQLFDDAGAAHARCDNDPEAAPILLSMKQLPWDKDFESYNEVLVGMGLRCGERFTWLSMKTPISGITDGHVYVEPS